MIELLLTFKYFILFIGCIFEGPVVMMSSGFLYRLGGFEFLPMYIALVSGDFVADIGWYCLGRFGGRPLILKFGNILGINEEMIAKVQERFYVYHEKILIISKLTMGLGFALLILVVAGILRVPFKKYVIINFVGGFIWTGFLITVGYFFGNIYALITGPEKIVFLGTALLVIIIIVKAANKYLIKANILKI